MTQRQSSPRFRPLRPSAERLYAILLQMDSETRNSGVIDLIPCFWFKNDVIARVLKVCVYDIGFARRSLLGRRLLVVGRQILGDRSTLRVILSNIFISSLVQGTVVAPEIGKADGEAGMLSVAKCSRPTTDNLQTMPNNA